MAKEYQRMSGITFSKDLDDFIQQMMDFGEQGRLVEADFNGHIFHSDTITVDSAYLEVIGMSKDEYEIADQEYEARRRDRMEDLRRDLLTELEKRAPKILDEQYMSAWNDMMDKARVDEYDWMNLGDCLAIVEALNSGCDFNEVKSILDAQDNNAGKGLHIADDAARLCDRGQEFANYAREGFVRQTDGVDFGYVIER